MPESTQLAENEAALIAIAQSLATRARPTDVILLTGPLGAGKTSFARAFIRALTQNPGEEVPSPTFTLVQTYQTPGPEIHHYDLYRLASPAALEELAWDEAQAGITLVEWPDRLGPLAPPEALRITISLVPSGGRALQISGPARWFHGGKHSK